MAAGTVSQRFVTGSSERAWRVNGRGTAEGQPRDEAAYYTWRTRSIMTDTGAPEMPAELLSPLRFTLRLLHHFGWALLLTLVSLSVGAVGYHLTASLGWLDSYLNASMILTGMGPLAELHTPAAKLFAMLYALYSGVFFVSVTTILVYPVMHRLLRRVHIEASRTR